MKKLTALILSLVICLTAFAFAGCKSKNEPIKVLMLDDLNAASAVLLMKEAQDGNTKNQYTFKTESSVTRLIASIGTSKADIAIAPAYAAASVYNKTKGDVRLLGIVSAGELSLLENGNTINSLSDLKGKEVYVSGKSSDTEFILKKVLSANGVKSDEVTVTKVEDDKELTEAIVNGTAKITVANQPVKATVLSKVSSARSVRGLNSEWNSATNSAGTIQVCVFATTNFVEDNGSELKKFIKEYKEAVYMASTDKTKAAKLCAEFDIMESEEIAKAALKNVDFKFVDGADMKTAFKKNINALHKVGMKAIGQKAPGSVFYYGVKD